LCAYFEYDIALHVDTTTLTDGTYELIPEPEKGVSEDQVNVTKGLFEAPNQSSEDNNTNIPDSNPTQEGKPRCIPQYFHVLQFHYYIRYLALRLGVEMKP
jgi:hypothetical protein